jgi:hypothetical protein
MNYAAAVTHADSFRELGLAIQKARTDIGGIRGRQHLVAHKSVE